jgi:cytochrome P450
MLFHIYSDPTLLNQLRAEISATLREENKERTLQSLLDTNRLTSDCPLLQSTFKEVLRVHAASLSTRIVLEDTLIGDNILLKKGGIVHMPSTCLHSEEEHFGPNAGMFDSARFLKDPLLKPQIAFRPFGGGSTLCPGRHFATMQILSTTALILLSYDILQEDGNWTFPKSLQSTMTTTVLPPVGGMHVRFQIRKDVNGGSVF